MIRSLGHRIFQPWVVLAAEERELVGESLAVGVALGDALARGHHVHRGDDVAGAAGSLVDLKKKEISYLSLE